jgi:4-hydroxy-4-methyl-2-oxoglutarate aldolase
MPTLNSENQPLQRIGGEHAAANPLDALREFDACTIANAIEEFGVRLRNEGFTRPGLRCVTSGLPKLIGNAATCRVRSSDPPIGGGSYFDRTDWWDLIAHVPLPRIAVIQDLDAESSFGSTVGEVHSAILKAFGCAGVITNGAVRDIPGINAMDFPVFASAVAVSHSYLHVVDYCTRVDSYGLEIHPGDLLFADCHGVISIPPAILTELPAVAARIRDDERRIIDICLSPGFSPQKLKEAFKRTS